MEFILKCQQYFGLNKDETVDFFKKAFSSSGVLNIDTAFFPERRRG
jgi:hypothetical protein